MILAIDAGTQSIRAGLVDRAGNIQHFVKHTIESFIPAEPGRAEQDPEYYWNQLCAVTREIISKAGSADIAAVALTTQRLTMLALDKDGNPLDNAITWLDIRKADHKKVIPLWFRIIGKPLGISALTKFAASHARSNWWEQNKPEVWEKTAHYVYLSGFFTYRLTGEFNDSVGNMIGTVPFNVKKSDWVGFFDVKNLVFPINKELLPKLIPQTGLQGHVTKQASEQTLIPEGIPLIAASNDKACDLLGAACLTPETAAISYGTTATVNTHTDKYVELKRLLPPFPSAIPGGFYTEISVTRGLWMISWFKEEFGLQERLRASKSGELPEELLEKLIKDIPPGSMGLLVQPHWTAGPLDEPFSKGAVIGFGDIHTRAHLYRAILEGIVYALKAGAELTAKKNRVNIVRVHATGGGSGSDTIMQMTADILGLPTYRMSTAETSIVGAAIDAALGIGWYPDVATAVSAMTRVTEEFLPDPKNAAIYEDLYRNVYLKMYGALLPLNKNIQRITGYPAL